MKNSLASDSIFSESTQGGSKKVQKHQNDEVDLSIVEVRFKNLNQA